MAIEGEFPKITGDLLFASEVSGLVPVGTILPWLKSFTNTPALSGQFVECNGQVLDDADSVYDTQTIPDLNASSGTARFLRGATSSGGTGGTESHTHTTSGNFPSGGTTSTLTPAQTTSSTGTLPSYYEVVWIIRIK